MTLNPRNCVKKQVVAFHHDRNLNIVAFGQDHVTIEFLQEDLITRKAYFEALQAAVGLQGSLNESAVRAAPYQILFYRLHRHVLLGINSGVQTGHSSNCNWAASIKFALAPYQP